MEQDNIRKLSVYESSDYHYKRTPSIILKGQWLEQYGFPSGTKVDVRCLEGKLIIEPRKE
jgi:hypothetical protein